MDSDLAITMQEWESGVMVESAMKIPNHCSAREKKQKQLLGITGNRTQGWKHYANILTPSIREEEGKGEIKMSTFMKGNWTQTPPPAQGTTELWITGKESLLGGNCPALTPFCYQSVLETGYGQEGPLPWPGRFYCLSLVFIQSWSLNNYIATLNKDNR